MAGWDADGDLAHHDVSKIGVGQGPAEDVVEDLVEGVHIGTPALAVPGHGRLRLVGQHAV